jgi:hypothetical protein
MSKDGIKPLAVVEWDEGEYAIGYSDAEPLFYFGHEQAMDLAGKLVAAYNENAANHVCKVIVYQAESGTWKCVECGEHHLGRNI